MGLCTVAAFAQPFGALIAYGALGENLSLLFEGAMYSMLAGILLFVALIELLPNAFELSKSRALPGCFTFLGMGLMAVVQTQLGHSHGHSHSHGNGTDHNHSHNHSIPGVYSVMSPYDDGGGGSRARFARAYNVN
jgi:hypothetical protein